MPVRLSPGGSRRLAVIALASASLVVTAALGSFFLSAAAGAWVAVTAAGPASPADGIILVTALGGMLLSLWIGLGMTLSALSALPGAVGHLSRRLAEQVAPAAMRKVVAFVLGTTLTAALVPGTAVAGIGHEALRPSVVSTAAQVSTAGGLPVAAPDASFRFVSGSPPVSQGNDADNVAETVEAAPPPSWSNETAEMTEDEIVVLRGDTLWSVAARHLGPTAEAADIDAEWHRWHEANRDVIGEDPDRLLPGQQLRPPPSPGAGS